MEAAEPVFRHLAASQMVVNKMDLWQQVCPTGPRAFEKLETAAAAERFSILWDGCFLDERIPVSDDEVVINPPLADALLFLLIVGADGGRVEQQGRMADLARLIFALEMPDTPFDEADRSSITLDTGELPGELGGVAPSAAVDWEYDAWPARLTSLGGIVTPRLSDDGGGLVESVEFCPFSPFDDPERLVAHLDTIFGNQVKRRVGDGPDVARIYRQNKRLLAVTYESDRGGRKYDACLRLE